MRVLCENCNQQYIIREDDLKAATSRFKCQKCSHFVIVTKPEVTIADTEIEAPGGESDFADSILNEVQKPTESDDEWPELEDQFDFSTVSDEGMETESPIVEPAEIRQTTVSDTEKSGGGMAIQVYMSITFILGFMLMAATMVLVNKQYIPALVNEQIDLRTAAISQSFSGAVKEPLLVRNYLRVNQEAERVSQLPGVAYASVINKRNIVIAGVFAKPSLFEPVFLGMVEKTGFPKELAGKNNLHANEKEKGREFTIGGQPVYDVAISLGEVGGEVHVGLFTADIQAAVKKTIIPMLIAISILFIFGVFGFLLLARFISKPIQDLTEMADRISQGEIDERIVPKGPREIRALGRSLERMRMSVRTALRRLQR